MTGRQRIAAAAAMLAVFFLPGVAHAPPFCSATNPMIELLAGRYGERPVAAGVTAGGELLQLLISPDSRSWTILLTRPDGVSCLLAAGHDWQTRDPLPGEPL